MTSKTRFRYRRSAALVLGGLLAGLLAVAPSVPAVAAEGTDILVYRGNSPAFPMGFTRFGTAVGLPVQESVSLPADLSGFACIVLPTNSTAFSVENTAALANYVSGGGNLLAVGDSQFFAGAAIATMNQVAAGVGASISLTSQTIDFGAQLTDQVDASPLTVGVTSIFYGTTTGVAGVTPGGAAKSLVRTRLDGDAPGTTFIAAERVGAGTFVLLGDSNVLNDSSNDGYTAHDNGVLAHNLCLGSLVQYRIDGFFGPVDNGVVNTVKGGSTVPVQFRVYDGDTEITDPAIVESFTTQRVTCPDSLAADEVEVTLTGSTSLQYTDGKFLQLWKTPKVPGCYQAAITTTDATTLTADFRLR